jgi:hypothetical protein
MTRLETIILLFVLNSECLVLGFQTLTFQQKVPSLLSGNRKSSYVEEEAVLKERDEKPAGIVGAEFFGGNKQKEELFDPIAEANANAIVMDITKYNKWSDNRAFPDPTAQAVAKSIQGQLNGMLYTEEEMPLLPDYIYSPDVEWKTPFLSSDLTSTTTTPFAEIEKSLSFYNRLDIAITSGKTITFSEVELRWEISVVWPNFWGSRVIITGKSTITLNSSRQIIRQIDILDDKDLTNCLTSQVLPRFWDTYHIGMTPSAEISPKFPLKPKGFLRNYKLYNLPPRLVYTASLCDTGNRDDAVAATVPNHAFCDYVKTMGPRRQRYVTTSPLEVKLVRDDNNNGRSRLNFQLPISVELQTNPLLPYPGEDPETLPEADPKVDYLWQEARCVATLAYAGDPQDEEVSKVRKELYEQAVVKDGFKPKLDVMGRPQFFFWSNNVKNCYTENGLGMAVYEYRAKWAKANEVGLELELESVDIVI